MNDCHALVSVIIPAHNRAHCIETAILSALNQDWPALEVIVIDDASTDNTADIVKMIGDPRVILMQRQVNGGAAAARNDGIRAAKGRYIALLDSDDRFLESKIRKQAEALIASKGRYRLSCTALTLELASENTIVDKYHLEPVSEFIFLFKGCDLSPGSTLMAEKSLFSEIGYFDTCLRRFEDWDWLIRAVKKSDILRINEKLSHVYNVRSRLSEEVTQSARDFIAKRERLYPEISTNLHKQANALIWMQSVGTAWREKKYKIAFLSSLRSLSSSPHLFFNKSIRSTMQYFRKSSNNSNNSRKKNRITFVIHGITAGGAERVLVYIANWLANSGWEVNIAHFKSHKHKPFYKISPNINIIPLGISSKHHGSLPLILRISVYAKQTLKLRRAIRSNGSNVVVSFMDAANVLSIFSLIGSGIPVIACERNNPSMHKISKNVNIARNVLYPMSAMVTVQTKEASYHFSESMQGKMYSIPNPVPVKNFKELKPIWSMSTKKIVAVGRLDKQKGFDVLLNAFSIFARKNPGWTLTIAGEGPERLQLEQIIKNLSLENIVELPGNIDDVRVLLKECSIFVLSSRYEGFPNVLLEAMASGRPVVSTDCKSGPSEILEHGRSGLLVPPEQPRALADAIEKLASSPDLAEKLRILAHQRVREFDEAKIMSRWDQLISSVIRS